MQFNKQNVVQSSSESAGESDDFYAPPFIAGKDIAMKKFSRDRVQESFESFDKSELNPIDIKILRGLYKKKVEERKKKLSL